MATAQFIDLVQLSLREPRQAMRALINLNLSPSTVWQAVLFVAVANVLVFEFSSFLAPPDVENAPFPIPPIVTHLLIQLGLLVVMAGMAFGVGRLFGGKGSFLDCLVGLTWLQIVLLVIQVAAIAIGFILPVFSALMLLISFFLLFYLTVQFIMEIHDFENAFVVLIAMIACGFFLAFLLSILLLSTGVVSGVDAIAASS